MSLLLLKFPEPHQYWKANGTPESIFMSPIFRPPPSAATGPTTDTPGTDLFLVCSSKLKEYRNESGSWTSTDALIQCARKYMLEGASFDVLCEHNAQVHNELKRGKNCKNLVGQCNISPERLTRFHLVQIFEPAKYY